MKKNAIAVLMSGGLDSDVLAAELAQRYQRVYPVYIRQGLRWEAVELFWLKRFLRATHLREMQPLQVFQLPLADVYRTHWSLKRGKVPDARTRDEAVYLPGRNLILLVKVGLFCALQRISEIALAPLDHNPFPDATPAFFASYAKAMSRGLGHRLIIRVPYREQSKAAVIKRGKGLPLHLSFSCLAPVGKKHCGNCNKCAERQRAFRQARVEDLTVYAR